MSGVLKRLAMAAVLAAGAWAFTGPASASGDYSCSPNWTLQSADLDCGSSLVIAPGSDTRVNLALLLPSLSVGARRLHDMGKSGWFQLIWLIPFIGWAVMIYWLVQPSVAGSNQYGEGPAMPADVAALPPGAV